SSPPGCRRPTSTGHRCRGSTVPTATATSSAPAPRWRISPTEESGPILLRVPGQWVAIGVAALAVGLLAACGARAAGSTAQGLPDELLPLLTGQLDCAGSPLALVRQHAWDFTGDGVPDALVAVRCDSGAGSPPSAVFAIAAGAGRPSIVGELLRPSDNEVVS